MPTLVYDHPELADALTRLLQFTLTRSEGRPPSVRTADLFQHPHTTISVSLNRKTTVNQIHSVDLDQLEPTQEFIPLDGLSAYILNPRPDPPDVVQVTMFDGRERLIIQEGHTRLGAAVLLGAGALPVRVWKFQQAGNGTFDPVPRGRHRHGLKRSRSLDDDLEDWFDLGGTGSGNFGHAGRPGEIGGSAPAGEGGGSERTSSASAKAGSSKLSTGSPKHTRSIGGDHVNAVYMTELDDGTQAVYKPENGEAWKLHFANGDISGAITNRTLSLAERETMAYEVDQLVGTELVPETVLRDEFLVGDVEQDEDYDDGGYDEDELRGMYDEYREDQQNNAYEHVGEQMGELFGEAQNNHLADLEQRADELGEIWNAIIDEHPEYDDSGPYGSRTAIAEHPTLPMGSAQGFERQGVGGDVDPIAIIDEANVNVDGSLTDEERVRVRELFERELAGGAQNLLDVDSTKGREHLEYDAWLEAHADTEGRLLDEAIPSFTAWRNEHGYEIHGEQVSEGPRIRNREAPHPQGGMLQKYVDDLRTAGSLDMERGEYHQFAVLDYLIGSMDRHGGNVFEYGEDSKPLGMDNGYSFPNRNAVTYRSSPVTALLRFGRNDTSVRQPPPALREKWLSNITTTNWNKFVTSHRSMSEDERTAFLERVDIMKDALSRPEGLYDLWKTQKMI